MFHSLEHTPKSHPATLKRVRPAGTTPAPTVSSVQKQHIVTTCALSVWSCLGVPGLLGGMESTGDHCDLLSWLDDMWTEFCSWKEQRTAYSSIKFASNSHNIYDIDSKLSTVLFPLKLQFNLRVFEQLDGQAYALTDKV